MTNQANALPNGCTVRLPDGNTATCYREPDGTYRTVQLNEATGGQRVDLGWRREQLEELP